MSHDDWYNQYLKERERRASLSAQLRIGTKTQLFDTLAAAGIARVVVCFDGAGDSGQIEDIQTFASGNKHAELPGCLLSVQTANNDGTAAEDLTLPLKEVIERLCYDFLEDHHDGWEINDGAFGEFELDVAARTVALTLNERFSDFSTSTHAL